jgi:hypothetical protein
VLSQAPGARRHLRSGPSVRRFPELVTMPAPALLPVESFSLLSLVGLTPSLVCPDHSTQTDVCTSSGRM